MSVKKIRKRVLDEINLDTSVFMTSFDKAAALLLEHKKVLESAGWSSVHLKMQRGYDYGELVVKGMRLETDKEFEERIKQEEAQEKRDAEKEAKAKARRKRQYDKLKEEFG